jgi:hypothetical protein
MPLFIGPEEAQGVFQNILLEPSMTHPNKRFHLLTFKTSLSEEEMTSTIYVCTSIGAADYCSNVHLPVRQKTIFPHNLCKNALF